MLELGRADMPIEHERGLVAMGSFCVLCGCFLCARYTTNTWHDRVCVWCVLHLERTHLCDYGTHTHTPGVLDGPAAIYRSTAIDPIRLQYTQTTSQSALGFTVNPSCVDSDEGTCVCVCAVCTMYPVECMMRGGL